MVDMKDLPTQLESKQDYEEALEKFVLPFLQERVLKIADVVEQLHTDISKDNISEEKVVEYINEVISLSSFANENSLMFPYFEQVMQLEAQLYEEGAFDNETE